MNPQQEATLKALKRVDRFKRIKQAGWIALFGVVMIPLGILVFDGPLLDFQPLVIVIGFGSFFVAFGFVFAFALTAGKKQQAFLNIIYHDIWEPFLQSQSIRKSTTYTLLRERNYTPPKITHEFLPSVAGETFHYALTSDRGSTLYALEYSHQTNTGTRAHRFIDFMGFVITTNILTSSNFYVREHKPITQFITSGFKSIPIDKVENQIAITGEFTPELEKVYDEIRSLGFPQVSLLEQDGKVTVLVSSFNLHGRLSIKPTFFKATEEHLVKLIQLITFIESLEAK